MHSKNNNKTQTHIQGLRSFSSLIPKTLKKHLRKGGYNYSNIVDNWTNIMSKKISDECYPISVKMGKKFNSGTLILNVFHGKEIEIEYKKKEIIDKINSFFGYNCINQIILKIVQDKIVPKKNVFNNIKNLSKIEKKITNTKDNNLKNSLNKFLNAYKERKNE